MPVMRNGRIGPSAAMPIGSPGRRCSLFATAASTTTWCGPWAQRPSVSSSGLKRGSDGSMPSPNVGFPFESIVSPFLTSFACVESPARSSTWPAAASTSGSARIRSSSAGETVALPLAEKSTILRPLTTASVRSYEAAKIESNAFEIVSVRTKLPLTSATPTTIASAVRAVRSLRPSIRGGRRWSLSRHLLQRAQDPRGRAALEIADDGAVGEDEHAVGRGRGARVVGDHDRRLPELLDRARGAATSTSAPVRESRLPVGSSAKTTVGPGDQRAGDRDALLLAAGQLGGPVRRAGRRDRRCRAARRSTPRSGLRPARPQRQQDVLLRGQRREQVEELEDEADVLPAQLGQLAVAELS